MEEIAANYLSATAGVRQLRTANLMRDTSVFRSLNLLRQDTIYTFFLSFFLSSCNERVSYSSTASIKKKEKDCLKICSLLLQMSTSFTFHEGFTMPKDIRELPSSGQNMARFTKQMILGLTFEATERSALMLLVRTQSILHTKARV